MSSGRLQEVFKHRHVERARATYTYFLDCVIRACQEIRQPKTFSTNVADSQGGLSCKPGGFLRSSCHYLD